MDEIALNIGLLSLVLAIALWGICFQLGGIKEELKQQRLAKRPGPEEQENPHAK